MKRIATAATLTATSAVLLVGSAGAAAAHSGGAKAHASKSPGVISGNVIQIPIRIPINVCGNSVNVVGAINPAFGNVCINK